MLKEYRYGRFKSDPERVEFGIESRGFCLESPQVYSYITRDDAHILLSLKREIESQLEAWYPGCVFPVPEEEVDADVMREWSQMQERI